MTFAVEHDSSASAQDDLLTFSAEEGEEAAAASLSARPWQILIADDDEEVHQATAFALRGVTIDGRELHLLRAHSAVEAEAILRSHADVAVAMLDVVMETSDAGLRLVGVIRDEIGLRNLRIVLRTGQPGYAPEVEVIQAYDINDYRTKSELTQTRLITTLTSAVRAYHQLEQVHAANRGMDAVARAANAIFRLRNMNDLARLLSDQMSEILGMPSNGLVCVERSDVGAGGAGGGLRVVYGCGQFASFSGMTVEGGLNPDLQRSIKRCLAARTHIFEPDRFLLWLGRAKSEAVAVFCLDQALSPLERRLVEMFATSLSVSFENVELIERLDFFAHFDPLTQLPNRTRFVADVEEDLYASQTGGRCLAVADIVRFSEVNDALGYRCGDSLLVLVCKRLRGVLGASVKLARIAADAFGIYGYEDVIDENAIRQAFEAPFFVHGHALTVQIRLGVVRASDGKGNALELLRNAGLALSRARLSGGSVCVRFSSAMSDDAQTRITLLHSLRAAIDFKRGLSLHFQPVINVRTNAVCGVEAFIRWRSDQGQLIPPGRFIPLAEQTGMIGELGYWVLETALHRLSVWQGQGHDALCLSVNVSAVQFRDENFAARVLRALEVSDVAAAHLTLDLTEAIGQEDRPLVEGQLKVLRDEGVRVAMDDFGTGSSSLRQLLDYPLDSIKIDRLFVERALGSEADRVLVRCLVDMARGRGLAVVAKGVETLPQVQAMLAIGCEHMQGYHFCRPLNSEQFDIWLREGVSSAG